MFRIRIGRPDITGDDVSAALRQGLSDHYHVLPGTRQRTALIPGAPAPAGPDTVLVGTGSDRVWRTQVRIVRQPAGTYIQLLPGGLGLIQITNLLGITRKIRRVLLDAPGLGAQQGGRGRKVL